MQISWFGRFRRLFTKDRTKENSNSQELFKIADQTPAKAQSVASYTDAQKSSTLSTLNVDAARRQARIGNHYARHSKTDERLQELQVNTVTLPPHRPWTGDYTDWIADPFSDLNWRFQFHTLRWINPYLWDALEGNPESREEWKRIVRSWQDANTPPHDAPDKYAWIDMTDGNRAIQLSIGAPLIDDNDLWYVDLLLLHRNWLLDENNIVGGNHGLHQNLGLFVVSLVLRDIPAVEIAIKRLGNQVLEVFEERGLNEEGSIAYHQSNLDWWTQTQERLVVEGYSLSDEATQRLEKAGEALAYLLLPNGTMPQIGDGGRGKGRLGLHPFLDQVIRGNIQEQSLPLVRHYQYGFTVFRSGWGETRTFKDESHTVIRHGADLKRHSHNDRGSLHLYTAGRRWITDGGFHSYQQRNRDRNYTKSRRAHSLINLPDQKYTKSGNVPVQYLQSDDEIHSIEILDENFEAACWRRRVIFLPKLDIWIIWDRTTSNMSEEVRQQWLIDLGVKVTADNDNSIILDDSTTQLKMHWLGDQPTLDVAQGDTKSGSRRGLIGIGWKKMRAGTSIHANFQSDSVDSIVVITNAAEPELTFDIEDYNRSVSFILNINRSKANYRLNINPDGNIFSHR